MSPLCRDERIRFIALLPQRFTHQDALRRTR